MIHEGSVQIEATSPASPRALARVRRCARAWERGLVVVSGKGRASVTGMSGSSFPPEGKFSALQSLENSQNEEGISILREPVPGGSAWLTRGQRGAALSRVNTGGRHCKFRTGLRPVPLDETGDICRPTVMAGLVWGFLSSWNFAFFRPPVV